MVAPKIVTSLPAHLIQRSAVVVLCQSVHNELRARGGTRDRIRCKQALARIGNIVVPAHAVLQRLLGGLVITRGRPAVLRPRLLVLAHDVGKSLR